MNTSEQFSKILNLLTASGAAASAGSASASPFASSAAAVAAIQSALADSQASLNQQQNEQALEQRHESEPQSPRPQQQRINHCTICNKELCNKYFMKTHMLKMHGINLDTKPGSGAGDAAGDSMGGVVCDICNKELCSKYFLKVHKQNTHGIATDYQDSSQFMYPFASPLGAGGAMGVPPLATAAALNPLAAALMSSLAQQSQQSQQPQSQAQPQQRTGYESQAPHKRARLMKNIGTPNECPSIAQTANLDSLYRLAQARQQQGRQAAGPLSSLVCFGSSVFGPTGGLPPALVVDMILRNQQLNRKAARAQSGEAGEVGQQQVAGANQAEQTSAICLAKFKNNNDNSGSNNNNGGQGGAGPKQKGARKGESNGASQGNSKYFSHYTEACPMCERRFKSIKWLKTHMMNDHKQEIGAYMQMLLQCAYGAHGLAGQLRGAPVGAQVQPMQPAQAPQAGPAPSLAHSQLLASLMQRAQAQVEQHQHQQPAPPSAQDQLHAFFHSQAASASAAQLQAPPPPVPQGFNHRLEPQSSSGLLMSPRSQPHNLMLYAAFCNNSPRRSESPANSDKIENLVTLGKAQEPEELRMLRTGQQQQHHHHPGHHQQLDLSFGAQLEGSRVHGQQQQQQQQQQQLQQQLLLSKQSHDADRSRSRSSSSSSSAASSSPRSQLGAANSLDYAIYQSHA